MKKLLKTTLKILLALIGLALAAVICTGVWIFIYSARDKKQYGQMQLEHIEALEAQYKRPDYVPSDEQSLTGFDVSAAIKNNTRLNELRFLATHNSYKAYNPSAEKLMKYLISPLGFAWDEQGREWSYGFEPLSDQLDQGIRSFELDIMREGDGFRCAHIPVVDYASNCPNFSLALREIALWSDAHPGHMPITVLVEAKSSILSGGKLFHNFNLDDVLLLEELVAGELGERLYTPGDMLGEHEDFFKLRAANSYPRLLEMLGKILLIYHYNDLTTQPYTASKSDMRALKMFPSVGQWMLYYQGMDPNQAYACFVIDNNSDSLDIEKNVTGNNMLVRTRIDSFPWRDDEWEAQALGTEAFLLTTDWPPRNHLGEDPHVATLPGGATVGYR